MSDRSAGRCEQPGLRAAVGLRCEVPSARPCRDRIGVVFLLEELTKPFSGTDDVYRRKRSERQYEARMEKSES